MFILEILSLMVNQDCLLEILSLWLIRIVLLVILSFIVNQDCFIRNIKFYG